nr:class I SAM-dependent methyltransferase [uncultured Undibacterium sp.]
MSGTSKALMRRVHDQRFTTRYFVGNGIDIGCGPDPIAQYHEQFPLIKSVKNWDIPDGDAQYLATIPDGSLDFAHSSHSLEHMVEPRIALVNWLRVLKPGGHLVVMVPDEDLYEQGEFPSTYNDDHKWTFTIQKSTSWSPKSVNLMQLLPEFSSQAQILKLELLDATYRYQLKRFDQTLTPVAECGIEFVMRKLPPDELTKHGRFPSF